MNGVYLIGKRHFVAYFHHTGWENIQLGISVDVWSPNAEVHIPGGFFRVGWVMQKPLLPPRHWSVGVGT